ncbi:unnamed protein product, partial [Candidula unifasciata]
ILCVFMLLLTAVVVSADCPGQALSTKCREGWTYFNGSCYGFGDVPRNWVDAAAYCFVHGAYLVEIESERENTWLVNTIKAINFGSIWIGGSEVLYRKAVVWAYSGNTLTYQDWSPGQPADPPGVLEDCTEIRQPFGYKWNDFQCDQLNRFVCET